MANTKWPPVGNRHRWSSRSVTTHWMTSRKYNDFASLINRQHVYADEVFTAWNHHREVLCLVFGHFGCQRGEGTALHTYAR
jgi:hypothetical protein